MKNKLFCEICGKILEIRKNENKLQGLCSCGFTKQITSEFSFSEKAEKKEETGEGIAKEIKTPGFPHECKKCGYEECEVYDLGAQYSDESNVILYKCKKCNYTERQADGTGNT